jgi:hypothetical protein
MSNWPSRHKRILVAAIAVTVGAPVAAQTAAQSAHNPSSWNTEGDPTPAGECPKEKRPPHQPVAVPRLPDPISPVQLSPLGCPYLRHEAAFSSGGLHEYQPHVGRGNDAKDSRPDRAHDGCGSGGQACVVYTDDAFPANVDPVDREFAVAGVAHRAGRVPQFKPDVGRTARDGPRFQAGHSHIGAGDPQIRPAEVANCGGRSRPAP